MTAGVAKLNKTCKLLGCVLLFLCSLRLVFGQMLVDAAIVVEEDGSISAVYDMNDDGAEDTVADLMSAGVEVADFRGKLIIPGFIDAHAHAAQVPIAKSKRSRYRCN